MNLCPKCREPIRIPQDDVVIIRTKVGRNQFVDHMAHKACPVHGAVAGQVGGQVYCSSCGHNQALHNPRCGYTSYGYECDCKKFSK